MLRTLGVKDNIRLVINKVLTSKGELRKEGREERVKLLRAFLSVVETGGKVRPLLNSHEGIELLKNVKYARAGAAQLGGHVNTLIFKGVEVATVNTTYMKVGTAGEVATQSAEYRSIGLWLIGSSKEVAESTEVSPKTVQSMLNDDDDDGMSYTLHILKSRLR